MIANLSEKSKDRQKTPGADRCRPLQPAYSLPDLTCSIPSRREAFPTSRAMISNSLSVLLIAGIGYDPALQKEGLEQAASTIFGIKAMVVGFPLLAAIISFLSFTFIWNINKDVRAKMSEWKKSIGRE